jgi:hypothetical protein
MVPDQELGDFELDDHLQYELSTLADNLGEASLSRGWAEEMVFEELAGELAFHGWPACRWRS